MAIIIGEGEHRYEVIENWGRLPDGWRYGEVAAVGVDSKDNVYVFSRSNHPMTVFDAAGNFLRSWGEGVFSRPHGVHVAPDDTLYRTDDGDHTVRRMTTDGKILLQIGVPGEPAPYMSGDPFNRCTHTALSPQGDIYVADGYGNARVNKYAPTASCCFPGLSREPIRASSTSSTTSAATRTAGSMWPTGKTIASRCSTGKGRFEPLAQYAPPLRAVHDPGRNPIAYIGESGPGMAVNARSPGIGPRVSLWTLDGKRIAKVGDATQERCKPVYGAARRGGGLARRHLCRRSRRTAMKNKGTPIPDDQDIRCMQKLVKLG